MENKLFLKKQAQKIYRTGGMEILLVSYPEIEGETSLARHCKTLIEALCTYAEGEPLKMASNALSRAIEEHRLFGFSRHNFRIDLDTVSEKAGIVCTLRISFAEGSLPIFKRQLLLFWDKKAQLQRKPPKRYLRSTAL